MKIYKLLFVLLLINFTAIFAQEKVTFNGIFESNGQPVFDVKIYIDSTIKQSEILNIGTKSNFDGEFKLELLPGKYTFRIQSIEHYEKTITRTITENYFEKIELKPYPIEKIQEVIINANRDKNYKDVNVGQVEIELKKLKTIPSFLGEVDVIKLIQFLPGVSSTNDGGQGFYVRGGGPDQNLILYDGAQVYNASHLFGFFSVFNSDVVNTANIIKGGIPAHYGGRISSILEIQSQEGNKDLLRFTGGLGLIASRLKIDGPTKNKKGNFYLAGRRTYVDLILKAAIPKNSAFSGSGYYFHDINAGFNYQFSPRDKISFSMYQGKDQFKFDNRNIDMLVNIPWGNIASSLKWNHKINDKMYLNTSFNFTDYYVSFMSKQDIFLIDLNSKIRDYNIRSEITHYLSTRQTLKYGINYTYHRFTPVAINATQQDVKFDTGDPQSMYGHEAAIYINDEFDVTENWRINAGLRYNTYSFVGPFTRYFTSNVNGLDSSFSYKSGELIKFYHNLEPRISSRWLLKNNNSIKSSFSINHQYVHLTSLSAVSLPSDVWFPISDIAKPQKGWQASVGYFQNFLEGNLETSIEVYYKQMNNLIEYLPTSVPMDNVKNNVDNLLVFGKGWSYGMEFFIKKKYGKLTGWIGYTLAKTERLFLDIQPTKFPAKYDRRHDLSIIATYEWKPRFHFGFAFIYATGNTLTLPTSWYLQDGDVIMQYGSRNSSRMAPYHRLDLSLTYFTKDTKMKYDKASNQTIEVKRKVKQNWNFSIYNIYNRANPYFLYVDSDGDILQNDFKISVRQVSLFPILPSVTWNFDF